MVVLSKHNGDACYACQPIVEAVLQARLEQAWEQEERFMVDAVVIELCSERGKVDDLERLLHTRFKQLIDIKAKDGMRMDMPDL